MLMSLIDSNQQDRLEECVQAYIDVIAYEPYFFKERLSSSMELAKFFLQVVRQRDLMLAITWLITPDRANENEGRAKRHSAFSLRGRATRRSAFPPRDVRTS